MDPPRLSRAPRRLAWVSFLLAAVAVPILLFAPLGVRASMSASLPGEEPGPERIERTSLVETEGLSLLPVLLIPAAVAAMPLLLSRTTLARKARFAAAGLLTVFSVLLMISVGWAYLPAAGAMWVAAAFQERSPAPASRTAVA